MMNVLCKKGETKAWKCPTWGCQIQGTVRQQWQERNPTV